MRPLRALVIYIIVVFIGGALLSPWLWHLAQYFAASFPRIAQAPFHRFLDRAFLILALAGIWPVMRALGVTSGREAGLAAPYGQAKKLWGGVLLGVISLSLVVGVEFAAGKRGINHALTGHQIIAAIFSGLATAVVVSTLEEILFRGGVFGGLQRVLYWPVALGISSVIYAFVHFLRKADIPGPVTWASGLDLLPRLCDLRAFFPEFLSLTLAGVLLGLAYRRTGNLYFSIGLHAGWIFVLKLFGALTVGLGGVGLAFWGTSTLIDGWLAFLLMAATLLVFNFLPLEKRAPYTIST